MKKVGLIAFVLTIVFSSCSLQDSSLINDIISANKTAVTADALPENAKEELGINYFGTYIDEVFEAEGLGFEVLLSDELKVYFDKNGGCLNGTEKGKFKGKKRGDRKNGRRPHGDRGEAIDVSELPTAVTNYIRTNYTGVTIDRARTHPQRGYMVKLSSDVIVLFDIDGNFVEEHPFIYHHGNHIIIDIADLSTLITDYITATYPNATIKVAFEKEERILIGLEDNDDRLMLVFDKDGNFIEEKRCND